MGKTLGNIIAVGIGIGLNFVPGVGTAISLGLNGTLGLGLSFAATQAVITGITLVGTAVALQAAVSLVGLGPSIPKPDTTITAIKTSRPPRVSAYGINRLYFAYALYETASNGTAIDIGAVHDGKMDGLIGYYLNDDPVTLTGDVVNVGADNRYQEAALSLYSTDGSSPGTSFAAVVALLPGIWTNNHRGDGVVMLAQTAKPVKSKRYLETYPNQVPVPSMVARWQRCPDPYADDPTDESEWTWTENPVRQLMHYKMVRERVDYASKIAPTIAYWRTASDICDEPVTLKAGGSEARYRSWLSHKHTDRHAEVTSGLLSAFDGWIAPRADGALVVYAGVYTPPDVSIGPDHILSYDWNGVGVDDDQAVNEIICSYVSVEHDYNTVECDAWRDESDIDARGQVLSTTLDPQVPSWGQVRRLAKRKMSRANALHRGTITTNAGGRIVRGKRYINLLLREAGTTLFNGPVEITSVTRNLMTGGVTFSWVAADPNIDTWNPATEEGEPAALGDRVAQEPLETPLIVAATADFSDIGESGGIGGGAVTGVRINITASGPVRDDLTWFSRWRVGSGAWSERENADADPGPGVSLVTEYVPYGTDVDVEVAYALGDGRQSPWSATETFDTSP